MKAKLIPVLVLAVLAFGFLSCGEEPYSKPEARLLSITIDDMDIPIPQAITGSRWDLGFDIYEDDYSDVSFKSVERIEDDGVRIRPVVNSGARAEWGIADRNTRATSFYLPGMPAYLSESNFIYIRVTAEDGETINYYRFNARISKDVRELQGLSVNGRAARMQPSSSPIDAWNTISGRGVVSITSSEALAPQLDPSPFDEDATVLYAVADNETTDPGEFGPASSITSLVDQKFLYLKVIAQNEEAVGYYRFRIDVGRMITLKKLEVIGGTSGDTPYEIVGTGAGGTAWTGGTPGVSAVSPGAFSSPHQPAAGFKIRINPDDSGASVAYQKVATLATAQPSATWISLANDTISANPLLFDNDEYLVIRVRPANSLAVATGTSFYKIKVSLLAADFLQQPKAAVYDANDTAAELTVTLDRTPAQPATYQWYEANSWYGGYGFDPDGRMGDDPNFNDDAGPVAAWHVKGLDEKSNVSFHNGGNQYYRLPTPGRPITGATGSFTGTTGASFVPPTNKKPFITGFSNETHYYWVVITDKDGLTATSARAVILTEWGHEYNLGVEGDPVEKKHFLVDLPNLGVPIKNPVAFTKFREEFSISLAGVFPAGFDIMDYSVATVQAKFYLKDGTPWIQNWTQGNFAFGTGTPSLDNNIVLYYNLTNNNGTIGLSGDSKEPQGANLTETPSYIMLMPSGEKPVSEMPPLLADGTPDPADGDAQGWFCGFIELVELRFEGPPREKD